MRRRTMLALLGALSAAPPAAWAAGDSREPAGEAFPLLTGYLAMRASERNLFYPAYRAARHGRLEPGTRAQVVGGAGGVAFPISIDRLGFVARLPTLADLRSGAQIVFEGEAYRFQLEARAALAPSSHPDPAVLTRALAQLNGATGTLAGRFAFLIPRLTAAFFPEGGGGHVGFADGHTAPLPLFQTTFDGPTPYFEPRRFAGATTILLYQAPTRITLGIPRLIG